MKNYKYILVGGGMTADSAVRGIRQVDSGGSIALFSQENTAPYNRPPLSKGLWHGRPITRIMRRTESLGVDMYLGCKVTHLNAVDHILADEKGNEFMFEKLLLATGGNPIHPPTFSNQVIFYRNLDDYRQLRLLVENGQDFAIIGGGFIGSEIAAALIEQKKNVTLFFPEDGIAARVLPKQAALFLNSYYQQKGVALMVPRMVAGIDSRESKLVVRTTMGEEILFDGVVAGLGIRPGVELALQAGLPVENGILVNEYLQTSNPDIYAAGDAANFYNSSLEKRIRAEHEENANLSGMIAGKNMAGQAERYDYLPYFYSDLFDITYEGVGEIDPSLDTVEKWIEPYRKGVIFYTRSGKARGVLTWNIQGKMEQARQLIRQAETFDPSTWLDSITRE